MKIGLLGLADKRHIVYSLVRVLGELSSTIIFTSNKQYLQMSPDLITDFELNDIRFVVYDCDIDEIDAEEYDLDNYEFVVYDILTEMPFSLDVAVIMDNRDEFILQLEDRELQGIPIFTCEHFEKGDALDCERAITIPPASYVEDAIQTMYRTKQLLPFKSGAFNKGMTSLVSEITKLRTNVVQQKLKKGVMELW